MADLGNRAHSMRLQCQACHWVPPEGTVMEGVQLHFQVEHDTDEVALELAAICSCGEVMTITSSRPTGGGVKDWLACGTCGNTGHLIRRETGRG